MTSSEAHDVDEAANKNHAAINASLRTMTPSEAHDAVRANRARFDEVWHFCNDLKKMMAVRRKKWLEENSVVRKERCCEL